MNEAKIGWYLYVINYNNNDYITIFEYENEKLFYYKIIIEIKFQKKIIMIILS